MEFALILVFLTLTYLIFGLGAYFLFYKVWHKKHAHRIIFHSNIRIKQLQAEAKGSLFNIFLFSLIFFVVWKTSEKLELPLTHSTHPGILFGFIQFLIIQALHDTYFYWTHRGMHSFRWLRKFHTHHHLSTEPTPLGALNFHPGEGIIQALFFVVIGLTLPFHWSVLGVFYFFQSYINMWGHTNYEFWPKNLFKHPVLMWLNTPTHHMLHHKNGNYNFGIYYNFWDKICGTNNPKYEAVYTQLQEKITS